MKSGMKGNAIELYTGESIRRVIARSFPGRKVIAVSNREPYSHVSSDNGIRCEHAASGLVSAVDPIMRASGGVWVALGTGDADRATVDGRDHVRVPPDEPAYTVRRVWLTPELIRQYYCGFANEAIWPACHLAFHRPQFTEEWWESYRLVNEIFAEAVLEEAADEPAAVLIQDYHFALLPRILKRRNQALRVALFWHIPWPSPETLRILPWKCEMLHGLLGADVLGFHLPEHCAGFLAAASDYAQATIEDRTGSAIHSGHSVAVRAIPIGVDFARYFRSAASKDIEIRMDKWRAEMGSTPEILGIGIDRIDYTKGIPERLNALDQLFNRHPEYIGRLSFVQVGVPSRTDLPEYQALQREIAGLVSNINSKWKVRDWKPIVLIERRVEQQDLVALHLLADFCVVSSLHDGMNLVAKEFVASRIDEDGVLILSEFAGSSKELTEALIVNPFCTYEIADAIQAAVTMPPLERRRRMAKLRSAVAANTIYRWGTELLKALAETDPNRPNVRDAASIPPAASPNPYPYHRASRTA